MRYYNIFYSLAGRDDPGLRLVVLARYGWIRGLASSWLRRRWRGNLLHFFNHLLL